MRFANVSLRPALPAHASFLEELTLAVRDSEPGFRDLAPGDRTKLLRHQHKMQELGYRAAYPQGYFMVITVDGRAAGRFTVAHYPDEIRVVDLALHPSWQGRGIGSELIRRVQAEAARTGASVRLHVINGSVAAGFYQRLGFLTCGATETHVLMEWRAGE